jgi:cyclopropane fatty-acyl-phospholipid synthase-like methyltransferase
MTNQHAQKLYSQKAKLYQSFFVNFLKWEKVLGVFFRENQYLHSDMKILDAGCGTGSVTKVLHDLAHQQGFVGVTFHAFDLTPAMLDLFGKWVKEEGTEDIQLQQANVLNLENQLPPGWLGYDLIVSAAMIEYIPKEELGQVFSNLKRLLNENGILILFVTRNTWIARLTGTMWWGTNLFNWDDLEVRLQNAGFQKIQFKKMMPSWNAFMMAAEAEQS